MSDDTLKLGALPRGYLSFSAYSTFLQCPKKYEIKYIEGRRTPPRSSMILGSGVHKGLEWGFTERLEKGEPPPLKQVQEATVAGIENEFKATPKSEISWDEGDDPDRLRVDGERVLAPYDPVRLTLVPLSAEKRFELDCGPDLPPVVGYTDLETKSEVIDYKVTAKSYQADAAEKSEQLAIYNLQAPKKKTALHVLVRTKEPKYQVLTAPPRTEAQKDELLENMRKVALLIRAAVFPKIQEGAIASACGWCDVYEICRGRKRPEKAK